MTEEDPRRRETFSAIDAESNDPAERSDSKILFDVLRQRRSELGGTAALPANDPQLVSAVRHEAQRRSQEIRASLHLRTSARLPAGQPIPLWLITLWILAVLGVAFLFSRLW